MNILFHVIPGLGQACSLKAYRTSAPRVDER